MTAQAQHPATFGELVPLPGDLLPLADVLADSLRGVAKIFDEHLRSDLPPVQALCTHIERYRGKMLRPTLCVLSGLASHPHAGRRPDPELVSVQHLTVGAVCEMVHMASLVHDDVLDEAETRRRGATVNSLRGNETAVILGDYLIASAFDLCASLPTPDAARAVGRASVVLCGGELLQLHHREDWSLDEASYFEIVTRKTAELIAVSADLGAAASGASEPVRRALTEYARQLGIAFQIQDDLLDLSGREDVVGKSVGRDVQKGKITLPLIHHLRSAPTAARGRSLMLLEAARQREAEHEAAGVGPAIIRMLEQTGSIEHARRSAVNLVERAKQELAVLPDTPARAMLMHMADAVISRAY